MSALQIQQLQLQLDEAQKRERDAIERADELYTRGQELATKLQDAEARMPTDPPVENSTDRLIEALNALRTQTPAETPYVVPINPVNNIAYEDHPPPAGHKDVKHVGRPTDFNGTRSDARPFLQRLEGVFALQAQKYRLTRTRIIVTCSHITAGYAKHWAESISKAVTENLTTNYYYGDDWAQFKVRFIQSYGYSDERQRARNLLSNSFQGKQPYETFLSEFMQNKLMGGVDDEWAKQYFMAGLDKELFEMVHNQAVVPTTLDGWVNDARAKNIQRIERNSFTRVHRSEGTFQKNSFKSSPFPPFVQKPRAKDPNAMDVDVLRQSRLRPGQTRKKPIVPKPPQKPRPGPSARTTGTSSKSEIVCYRCGRKGHFKRECTASVNSLEHDEILQLAEYALSLPRDDEDDEVEEPVLESDEETVLHDDNDDDDETPEIVEVSDFPKGPA